MIELFCRNFLPVPDDCHLTPIPAGEDISSLSAILLGDDYFNYLVSSRITIERVPTVPVQCLIPLKARAYLDLVARRDGGEQIDGEKITKHRNDVFRLYRTLAPADRIELPSQLREDVNRFSGRISGRITGLAEHPGCGWKVACATASDRPDSDQLWYS